VIFALAAIVLLATAARTLRSGGSGSESSHASTAIG